MTNPQRPRASNRFAKLILDFVTEVQNASLLTTFAMPTDRLRHRN